jgi:hypothetical protein
VTSHLRCRPPQIVQDEGMIRALSPLGARVRHMLGARRGLCGAL